MTQSVDPGFSRRMLELKQHAATTYQSLQGRARREWCIPKDNTEPLHDIANMHKPAFDREPLNAAYDAAVAGAAGEVSTGNILALRLQLAAVAAEERAYRHRHMSLPRAICAAHGRAYGLGEGSLFSPTGIEGDVAAYIKAGSAGVGV